MRVKRWSKKQFKPQWPRAQHKGDAWGKLQTRVSLAVEEAWGYQTPARPMGESGPDSTSLTCLGSASAGQQPREKRPLGPASQAAPHPARSCSTSFVKAKGGRGAASPPASRSATSLLAQTPPGISAFAFPAVHLPARGAGLVSAPANQHLPRSYADQLAAA